MFAFACLAYMKAFLKAPAKCVTHCAKHTERKLFTEPTLIQFNYKVNKKSWLGC